MDRRDLINDGGTVLDGGPLPVLLLRRDGRDVTRLRRHLAESERIRPCVVGPDALLRYRLRWPEDPRVQPLAVVTVLSDRPGSTGTAAQLVRRLGDVPLVVVADGPEDFGQDLLRAGVEEVVRAPDLDATTLERAVVAAVARRVRGVVDVNAVAAPVDLGRLEPETGGLTIA